MNHFRDEYHHIHKSLTETNDLLRRYLSITEHYHWTHPKLNKEEQISTTLLAAMLSNPNIYAGPVDQLLIGKEVLVKEAVEYMKILREQDLI